LSARSNQVAAVNQVSYVAGTYSFSDFADVSPGTFGAYFQTQVGGLRGGGVDQTIFRMVPGTSTKAGTIPAQSTAQTIPLYLIRTGAGGGTVRATVLSDFTLQGTAQGHIYNGLFFYKVTNGSVTDVKVLGIPGNASSQPGETFGINDYNGSGNVHTRVTVDGQGVGASGFGGNSGASITFIDCLSKGNHYSHGFAMYQMTGATFTRCVSTANGHVGFNFERQDGTVIMDHCDARGNGTYAIAIANDGLNNTGSARFDIRDPLLDAGAKLNVRVTGYMGVSTTTQDKTQITLSVGGVNRPDLLNFI
jgi:hypothetical protein